MRRLLRELHQGVITERQLLFRIVVASLFSAYTIVRLACTWRLRHVQIPGQSPRRVHERWQTRTRYEPGYLLLLRDLVFGAFVATGVAYPFYPDWVARFDVAIPDVVRWVAVGVASISLALLAWTHRALGEYWSAGLELKEGHSLITNGPYRYVRHPMYTAVFGFFCSVGLVTANWLIIGPAIAIFVVLSVRIRFEEAMMLDRFGETYAAYSKNTGSLIPRFRRHFNVLLVAVLLISGGGSDVASMERVIGAVIFPFEFRGVSLTRDEGAELRGYLATRMAMENVFKVVPEDQIKQELVGQKLKSWEDCNDQSCRKDLTKALSGDKVVTVKVVREGSICRVTADLFDVEREVSESGADVETDCGFLGIKGAMRSVAGQLSGKSQAQPESAQTPPVAQAQPVVQYQAPGGPDSAGITWVRIPAGTFDMGTTGGEEDEAPVHRVTLSAFDISATEVTVAQYFRCVDAGVCQPPHWDDGTCSVLEGLRWRKRTLPQEFRGDDRPVVCVEWSQARVFADWVGGRLPTEAEWEFAARGGGRAQQYPWGNRSPSCDVAAMGGPGSGCNLTAPRPVCSRPAGNTAHGLCDMAGNVWEWIADWYGPYPARAVTNPTGAPTGSDRCFRGGSFSTGAGPLRTFNRGFFAPGYRAYALGFRVARPAR